MGARSGREALCEPLDGRNAGAVGAGLGRASVKAPSAPEVVSATVSQSLGARSSWSSTVVPGCERRHAAGDAGGPAAFAVTRGATGTRIVGPASVPAEILTVAGAISFTVAAGAAAGPASLVQAPSTRCSSTAPGMPAAFPCSDTVFP